MGTFGESGHIGGLECWFQSFFVILAEEKFRTKPQSIVLDVSEARYLANELGWQCGQLPTLIIPKTDFKTAAWFCGHLHHHHRPQYCIIIALKEDSTH